MSGQIQARAQQTDRQCKNAGNLFSLGWHGHIERITNERMPKQIFTARIEGIT